MRSVTLQCERRSFQISSLPLYQKEPYFLKQWDKIIRPDLYLRVVQSKRHLSNKSGLPCHFNQTGFPFPLRWRHAIFITPPPIFSESPPPPRSSTLIPGSAAGDRRHRTSPPSCRPSPPGARNCCAPSNGSMSGSPDPAHPRLGPCSGNRRRRRRVDADGHDGRNLKRFPTEVPFPVGNSHPAEHRPKDGPGGTRSPSPAHPIGTCRPPVPAGPPDALTDMRPTADAKPFRLRHAVQTARASCIRTP